MLLDKRQDSSELIFIRIVSNVFITMSSHGNLEAHKALLTFILVAVRNNLILATVTPEHGGVGVSFVELASGVNRNPTRKVDAAAKALLVGVGRSDSHNTTLGETGDDDAVGRDLVDGDEVVDDTVDLVDRLINTVLVVLVTRVAGPVLENVEPASVALVVVLGDVAEGSSGAHGLAVGADLVGEVLGSFLPRRGLVAEAVEEDDGGLGLAELGTVSSDFDVSFVGEGDDGAEGLAFVHEVEGVVDVSVGHNGRDEGINKRRLSVQVLIDVDG